MSMTVGFSQQNSYNAGKQQVGFSGSKNINRISTLRCSGLGVGGKNPLCESIGRDIPTDLIHDNKLLDEALERLKGLTVKEGAMGNKSLGNYNPDKPQEGCNLHFYADAERYEAHVSKPHPDKGGYDQDAIKFSKDNSDPSILERLAKIFGN